METRNQDTAQGPFPELVTESDSETFGSEGRAGES